MIKVTESANSFRGVYYHKDTNFTKNQRKTIRQIKSTLGNLQDSRDFYVRSEGSSVVLSSIKKVKDKYKESVFIIQSRIGKYDLKHPFRLKDLKEADKERKNNILYTTSLFAMVILGFLFSLAIAPKLTIGKEKAPKIKTELIENADSLAKDTFNLIK